ncbi:NUDIX domain-containing protein [Staphylococcus intermedius]|uniref:MutT/nudix family protein n=1 Tax=Staphylococcus intermedius NCTC 11048 TaxID=1141106 RepID=A0A380G8D1_STAIN|nr:NUDIX domain-containing protein [Staphylococcus intermedius]PCF64704.1 DNA mismatch repair protein MutT [Staphylococcus intermedius]PCF80314.1 DNA mismatch repair protein MutT [Staphylococcus intermedius]PCF81664.1 DNA mismatch repair protein MutT [Staphylococcus intermedius]PCF88001.1 DNA mismatch repair protein MutT [Staphylococcus intermedius]PCF88714.1 DNA mismatch repair protein MutT [Staphylococcus intermedius]
MSKFDEQITVVPRRLLFEEEALAFNGFLDQSEENGQKIYEKLSQYEVKRRGDMEEDPSFKQLISYCLIENEHDELLVYERLSGGGEARLHGNASIGVGGHMNDVPEARNIDEVIKTNASRELEEEIGIKIDDETPLEFIGFINDDHNEVGQVHIGVVFKVKVQQQDVEVRETDTLKIQWQPISQINDTSVFESWSALILEQLK